MILANQRLLAASLVSASVAQICQAPTTVTLECNGIGKNSSNSCSGGSNRICRAMTRQAMRTRRIDRARDLVVLFWHLPFCFFSLVAFWLDTAPSIDQTPWGCPIYCLPLSSCRALISLSDFNYIRNHCVCQVLLLKRKANDADCQTGLSTYTDIGLHSYIVSDIVSDTDSCFVKPY